MARRIRAVRATVLVVISEVMFMPIMAFSQQTLDLASKNTRLELKPDKILCREKEYHPRNHSPLIP